MIRRRNVRVLQLCFCKCDQNLISSLCSRKENKFILTLTNPFDCRFEGIPFPRNFCLLQHHSCKYNKVFFTDLVKQDLLIKEDIQLRCQKKHQVHQTSYLFRSWYTHEFKLNSQNYRNSPSSVFENVNKKCLHDSAQFENIHQTSKMQLIDELPFED